MNYIFPPPRPPTLAVEGADTHMPIHRIYCLGRNYADHAREMGVDPASDSAFFFAKPADAVVASGTELEYPPATRDLQYEVELVVAVGRSGTSIMERDALDYVYGYAVGLDMTRRDLQTEAKQTRRPWDMGKGFDQSAPCSTIRPSTVIGHPERGAIWLTVNGERRQSSDLANHILGVAGAVALLSTFVRLEAGDLLFMGTPEGVGPVLPGDHLVGHIHGVGEVSVRYR